ncbi:MAG: ABC transporter ATP-binding protein, partial [Myxococcota bacterium]
MSGAPSPREAKPGAFVDFGLDLAPDKPDALWRGTAIAAAGAVLDGLPIGIAAWVLLEVAAGRAATLSPLVVGGGLAALVLGQFVAKVIGSTATFTATYGMACGLRLRVIEHVRRLPLGFWTRENRGRVLDTLTTQFDLYTEIFTHAWSMVVTNIALPSAMAIALFALDWPIALACVLPVPFAFMAVPWSFRRMNAAAARLDEARGELTDRVVEMVEGIETIRASGHETTAQDTFSRAVTDLERESMATEVAAAPAILAYSLVVHGGFIGAALVAAWRVATEAITPAWCVVALVVAVLFVRAQ